MLTLVLAAQLAAITVPDTATYSSKAVRDMIEAAAQANRVVPPKLGSYHADIESEVSIAARRTDGGEAVFSIEQMASRLTWDRSGATAQEVIGYRSQSRGVTFSTLGLLTDGWVVPSLYGNRLTLMFGKDTSAARRDRRAKAGDTRIDAAIHPLADDRETYYRFSGGDTVQTMRLGDRDIPIVRIMVTRRDGITVPTTLFDGEIDLDATRLHVVRMRGRFFTVAGKRSLFDVVMGQAIDATLFVELVSTERDGAYWMPTYQRYELQFRTPMAGDARLVARIVTRFREVNAEPPSGPLVVGADTMHAGGHTLVVAKSDTLRNFDRWRGDLGTLTSDVRASDFDDVGPVQYRATGEPLVRFQVERFADLLHVNRVEGVYTGVGVAANLRDAVPGLTVRATAGYAWTERTIRGRISADWQRGAVRWGLIAGRMLDNTNDFRSPGDSGNTLAALSGQDEYDYVDRSGVLVTLTQPFPKSATFGLRIEAGLLEDHSVTANLTHGVFNTTREFHVNRAVRNGRYVRTAVQLQKQPDLDASFARVGSSVVLRYERGDGDVSYQRVELRLMNRLNNGPWTFATRFDAGALVGPSVVPQQLFEIGRSESLQAYDFKEFAGDRAAVVRGLVMYRLPLLRAPIHIFKQLWLPEPSPALAVSLQSGWSQLSSPAAEAAATELRAQVVPTGTGRPRTTIGAGLRFFGGSVGLTMVRAIDHADIWTLKLDFRPQP